MSRARRAQRPDASRADSPEIIVARRAAPAALARTRAQVSRRVAGPLALLTVVGLAAAAVIAPPGAQLREMTDPQYAAVDTGVVSRNNARPSLSPSPSPTASASPSAVASPSPTPSASPSVAAAGTPTAPPAPPGPPTAAPLPPATGNAALPVDEARAANATPDAADPTWEAASATTVTLTGDSAAVEGGGATVDGATVTITTG
ncbi:hypothetical protein, partial [Tessaracoccus lapidicaptus]|uniref:hypothetical protein n=1 Tax=Tessaracoccus lapidicaptus TaxID=1427523 RepID=UPI001C401205